MWQCKIFARDRTMLGLERVISTEQDLLLPHARFAAAAPATEP